MTQSLSQAAQAVLKAAAQAMECPDGFLPYEQELMAAALRAAADLVTPQGGPFLMTASEDRVRHQLLAIAAELEGQQSTSSTH